MAIIIGKYLFEGPFPSTSNLKDRSGVYAIFCNVNNKYFLMDFGENSQVKTCIENNDRKERWTNTCLGTLFFFVYYTPNLQQTDRKLIEQELRQQYKPPCSER
jgi:hypothetical protein